MTAAKVEGMLVLDGLIEGRLSGLPDCEERLRRWAASPMPGRGRFSVEIQGARFSLLPDNNPISAAALGPDPTVAIAQSIEQMLKIFPPESRGGVFSTLRSIEFRHNEEVQTLYAIAPGGNVATQSRSMAANTIAPAVPLTRKEKIRGAISAVVVLAAAFGVSTVFVDYRALFRNIRNEITSPDPNAIAVDCSAFQAYFSVARKSLGKGSGSLVIELQRTDSFPLTDAQIEAATTRPSFAMKDRLALESLARGYIRCEFFDADGNFFAFADARIQGLKEKPAMELVLPLSSDSRARPHKIVLTY